MKNLTLTLSIFITIIAPIYAQKAIDNKGRLEAGKATREEMREAKAQANLVTPADFADPDSFGKNVKFLGSMYAGTLYIFRSCDPQILFDELGVVLAADDKCVVHTTAAPMASVEVFDPVWQISIPGRTVDNVIFPMLNHGGGHDIFNDLVSGPFNVAYVPRVTIESAALNDPGAINPNTGLPMNGTFTTSVPGTQLRSGTYTAGEFITDWTSRASVGGRGFSRTYWAALGLPQSVINNIYRQPMTLKFGIRARVTGPVYDAAFYYTVRLIGN
ncbi:MAG TPA: hypothetical protein VJL58_08840 [Pyrinomonadaceae bacterium]|nr:hypothetical protein [Pyrinomonadaceae bacterium]